MRLCASFIPVAACILFSTVALADRGKLTRDLTVGASQDVQLKANQEVTILKNSGTKVVIEVALPDGSKGIFQVDSTSVTLLETSPTPTPSVASTSTNSIPIAPDNLSRSQPVIPPASPMVADPNLPEDQTTLIHVTCPQGTSMPAPYASVYPVTAGNYSYRLYLPPGYYEHPTFHYPALFIMSPEGNATLGTFQARAHDEGWIAVMFVEAKNGDWGPIFGDMLATHADVTSKVRIQDGLKFATGLSGGARATSLLYAGVSRL